MFFGRYAMRRYALIAVIVGLVVGGCDQKQTKDDGQEEAAEKSAENESSADDEDSITDRMAEEHEGETPDATGAVSMEPRQPVETEEVDYAELDGMAISGYFARPEEAEGDLPGLIVIQEWWGLNDNIRKMTERLAGEGYAALAVDLYEGEVAETSQKARKLMQEAMKNEERLKKNLRQAYQHLDGEVGAPRIGVIGWCFGGGWSLRTALMYPKELDATVIYYGELVTDEAKLKPLETPIIGFFGSEDNAISPDKVKEFETKLGELGKEASVHLYDGANHAFANPSGERYDPEAAKDAWTKTVDFLEKHLEE
jgi:carboxymethylenebutenolidase